MMKRIIVLALCVVFATGCSTLSLSDHKAASDLQRETLSDARRFLRRSRVFAIRHPDAAAVYQLRAAEIACDALSAQSAANQKDALAILNEATADLAPELIGSKLHSGNRRAFHFGGRSYEVTAGTTGKPGVWNAREISSVVPAFRIPRRLCLTRHTVEGAGAPLVAEWRPDGDKRLRPFLPPRGPMSPVTAVLEFSKQRTANGQRTATIAFYDPSEVLKTRLAAREYPLAADFTAPIEGRTQHIKELWLGLEGVLNPKVRDANLVMLEPYDPNRLTVVFVHGLLSHPRMWRDVINDLEADPGLRGKLQFWVFYYPTGWPISYSALRLREELKKLQDIIPGQEHMVFVGHSMGGLLTRLQVISPGRAIWDTMLGPAADKYYAKLPSGDILKRSMLYRANPEIERAIFVCVPHRGSNMADFRFTVMISKLIRLPSSVMGLVLDLTDLKLDQSRLTSLYGLSPSNPLYKALDKVPIQVPHNTIAGDRGRGDTPNSSDGVVPYRSSHLDGAESELIVPDNHGAYDNPQAIAELKRILKKHLKTHAGQTVR